MIRVKAGVRLGGLQPQVFFAIHVAEHVWHKYGADELVITGGIEGKHMRGSEHYTMLAADLRTNNLGTSYDRGQAKKACEELAERLGPDFDVIFEGEGTPGEHCHCEFDPKDPYSV